ncbi:hypothetical protein [Agromyces indicus]|uniref:DUF222 domain-containing protein n=1 Tax=Agromyces indicus TaxID=758919 RepID=A0ABU1FJG3_9MICO|nr:hypothetical protein [Agromyces indicus]MDR5691910.1 hypothetical protein [Agromyces indicus]
MAKRITLSPGALHLMKGQLELNDIPVPSAITRGLELLQIATEHDTPPTGSVLKLTDAQARARVDTLAARSHFWTLGPGGGRGLGAAVQEFQGQVLREVHEAVRPDLDRIVEDLRPKFAELAEPLVVAAQEFRFTSRTSSDQVIDRADENASTAWRATRDALAAIAPIVQLRKAISETFDVSPTRDEFDGPIPTMGGAGQVVDYSVCFAEGDNWSTTGRYYLHERIDGAIDWLALAAGGLRLNTPTEVHEKLIAAGVVSRPFTF